MARKITRNYRQKFGPRKAIKYRKYAADLLLDYGRAAASHSLDADDIKRVALQLNALADCFDPPDKTDPFDGL